MVAANTCNIFTLRVLKLLWMKLNLILQCHIIVKPVLAEAVLLVLIVGAVFLEQIVVAMLLMGIVGRIKMLGMIFSQTIV